MNSELQPAEQSRVLGQLRRVLKDLIDLEAYYGMPMSLTREDLLREGLTEAAIDRIEGLLSYFTNPSPGHGLEVFEGIEAAKAAAVQQFADIVTKEKRRRLLTGR